MFDPFGGDDDDEPRPQLPFPTPMAALLLTVGSLIAAAFVAILFFEKPGLAAVGIGEALGIGIIATLAARRVPDPQPERLGLRGFSPRLLPALLCLLPLVLVVSEIDNWAADLDASIAPMVDELEGETTEEAEAEAEPSDAADATEPETGEFDLEGWALVEAAIVHVGISPVVKGFLFFGVILQGLVTLLGVGRGILLTGCLYALFHLVAPMGPDAEPFRALARLLSLVATGSILSLCRLATRSVLAPILLSMGFMAIQLWALAMPEALPIPGFNAELGGHTPATIVIPCALAVGWGLWVLLGRIRDTPEPPSHPIKM